MDARVQLPEKAKRGEAVPVRIVIRHPMETGYRTDDVGRPIKRNVIREFACRYDGEPVFSADLSSGIAANPYFEFTLRAAASGELEFAWVDDEGERGAEKRALKVEG